MKNIVPFGKVITSTSSYFRIYWPLNALSFSYGALLSRSQIHLFWVRSFSCRGTHRQTAFWLSDYFSVSVHRTVRPSSEYFKKQPFFHTCASKISHASLEILTRFYGEYFKMWKFIIHNIVMKSSKECTLCLV